MPQTIAKRRAVMPAANQPTCIAQAIFFLKQARNTLRGCGSAKAADYVQRAVKSTGGALRHANRMAQQSVAEPSLPPVPRARQAVGAQPQGPHDFVRRFLDISTAHLTASSKGLLDSLAGDATAAFTVGTTGYGWFTYAGAENVEDDDYPDDLRACWRAALDAGCDHVLFDRDAPALDRLPTYDEDDED